VPDLVPNLESQQRDTSMGYGLIKRYRPEGMRTELIPFHLGKLIVAMDARENISLKPLDEVHVFPKSLFVEMPKAAVNGEVRFPGTYSFRQGETLNSVLQRAGGFNPEAYLRGAFFTRESARKIQEQRLSELRDRLQQEIFRAHLRGAPGPPLQGGYRSPESAAHSQAGPAQAHRAG
jgi:hypothetical protein